jgi:hypothetical protein
VNKNGRYLGFKLPEPHFTGPGFAYGYENLRNIQEVDTQNALKELQSEGWLIPHTA